MVDVPVPMESKGLLHDQSRAELSQLKEEHTVDLIHHTPAHATAYGEQNDEGAPTASQRARARSPKMAATTRVARLLMRDFEGV